MANPEGDEFTPDSYKDAARRSLAAGIADESAAYELAIEGEQADPAEPGSGERA